MPYIDQGQRPAMDKIVRLMLEENVKVDGDLNYILFKFYLASGRISYNQTKNFIAELTECGSEIRARYLRPYEDLKIKLNGDVHGI